jgi:hypothetical protein
MHHDDISTFHLQPCGGNDQGGSFSALATLASPQLADEVVVGVYKPEVRGLSGAVRMSVHYRNI